MADQLPINDLRVPWQAIRFNRGQAFAAESAAICFTSRSVASPSVIVTPRSGIYVWKSAMPMPARIGGEVRGSGRPG
jgi:hypothetical protein